MLPEFGCRMHEIVFGPNTQAMSTLVAHYVEEALGQWEPRIAVTDVTASPDPKGIIRVYVQYRIKSTEELQELSLVLAG